ncbi:hypothetical protein ACH5A3_10330 [Streptomyces echinatus]|uniref:hypothetical protein n=1 Tax=Streptomyces echinatus TaxID=67293 RepID=UPI003793BE18
MSWEMALEYIRTLIWPAVTLALGLTFRRQLSSLFGRLQSLETPLGTAAFDRQAAAVAQEAAEIESGIADEVAAAEIEKPDSVDSGESQSPQDENLPLLHYVGNRRSSPENTFADLLNLAETRTTEAVLAAWREVDKAIKQTASESGISRTSMQAIKASGLLTDELARSVEDLRQLRDRVVHEGDIVLTPSGARSYVTAAKRIVDALALSSNPALQARQYEEIALRSLSIAGLKIGQTEIDHDRVDAYARTADGYQLAIQVLFRRGRKLTMRDITPLTASISERITSVLVITNAPITQDVRDFLVETADDALRVEVVQWRGPQDDDDLVQAIAGLAG